MIDDASLAKVMDGVGSGKGLEASLKLEGIQPTDAVMRWVKDNHKSSYKAAKEAREIPPGDPVDQNSDKVMECKWMDRVKDETPKDDDVAPEDTKDSLILRIK